MKSNNPLGRIPGAHKQRDKEIVKKYLAGTFQKDLAIEYGLSIASIRKICADKKSKTTGVLVIPETPYLYQTSLAAMVATLERLDGTVIKHKEPDDIRTNKGYTRVTA